MHLLGFRIQNSYIQPVTCEHFWAQNLRPLKVRYKFYLVEL